MTNTKWPEFDFDIDLDGDGEFWVQMGAGDVGYGETLIDALIHAVNCKPEYWNEIEAQLRNIYKEAQS